MQQKTKRIGIALIGGFLCLALIKAVPENNAVLAPILAAIFVSWIIYQFLCSSDLNTVPIKLPAGEDLIGRTPQYFYFRENSWLWYIKRHPFPFGSIIVTTRKVMFYYDSSWYDEILLKELAAIEWTEMGDLNFRYRSGGVEKGMRVMTWWGSYDPLLQLVSKAGVSVPEKPQKQAQRGDA